MKSPVAKNMHINKAGFHSAKNAHKIEKDKSYTNVALEEENDFKGGKTVDSSCFDGIEYDYTELPDIGCSGISISD
jgi:hypothetical protein